MAIHISSPLLNFGNLPVDSLNGVTQDELNLITELSANDCKRDDLVEGFIAFLENGNDLLDEPMLPEVSAAEMKELDDVEIGSLPASSRKQMEEHGKRFCDFLASRGLQTDLMTLSNSKLNQYLRIFYYQLRTKENKLYSPSSLVCIRAGIQRYLNVICHRPTNLVSRGTEFDSSNRMLDHKCREFIQAGQTVNSYDPIEDGDMIRLRAYFDRSDAEKLQDEVLFQLMYQLGERGGEHLEHFTRKDLLQRRTDADGRSYLCLPNLPSKNRRAAVDQSYMAADEKYARMYDTELLDMYAEAIPTESESFLPRPMKGTNEKKFCFSEKASRGLRWLQGFMKSLSEKAQLSKSYTNHCIRVTRVCDLDSAGLSLQEIMLVTGHKREESVRRYLRKRRDRSLYRSAQNVHAALRRKIAGAQDESLLEPKASTAVNQPAVVACSLDGAPEPEQQKKLRVHGESHKPMHVHIDGSSNIIDIFFQ